MRGIEEIKLDLIKKINELDEIKRLHELEAVIDSNKEIITKYNEIKNLQKKVVNSDYYNLPNSSKQFKSEIEALKAEISDMPFVDEYLELLEQAYHIIKNISGIIEDQINKNM